MDAIRTSDLTKTYGAKRAVDNVSLHVGAGEIYGFVGRNGAGKSTVMKMLAGLVLPTAGEIEILGERQAPGSTSRRLGALIENPGVHPGLSALDNVMVRALALGVPQARVASMDALEIVGLAPVAKKLVKTYSLGMKQRLGLALALVGSPDVLLLDEPFNGLDPQAVREVRTTIVNLARARSLTVFVSSHVLDQLERMVTRYGVIRDGHLVREMSAAEVDAECADYLSIRAATPQLALAKLQEAFPTARFSVMEDDAIRAEGEVSAEDAGRALSEAGIPVTELFVHERDIEELFVGLMGADLAMLGCDSAAWSQATNANRPRGFAGKEGGQDA
ncbi:ABC transporter ATP-binding protein [Adlercreutzia sp. ZJ141]|uniref:ABC transporter ATP-binding protein n=1 Tax=Adlercreutzia sp. ZJ141 TaxID=2709406 RepID=UPI0013EA7748|nr:ATP-binding cassette domain-containing protein [Adlercreutzia sp. ZJ141]